MRIRRSQENDLQKATRLAEDANRHAFNRSQETDLQTATRLAENSKRTEIYRSQQDDIQTATRLAEDANRHAFNRSQENDLQTASRLAENSKRTRIYRSQQDDIQTATRLADDANRHSFNRSQENDLETSNRLSENADRNRFNRSQELLQDTIHRQQLDADRQRNRRSESSTTSIQDMNIDTQSINTSITVMDIENAQLREQYQSIHPIPDTDLTFRTHRVLTPQEFQVNLRIENIRNNIQLTENNEEEVQPNTNFYVESFHNPDVSIVSQSNNHNNWQMYFNRYIIPGDGNCFFHAVNYCMSIIDTNWSYNHIDLRNISMTQLKIDVYNNPQFYVTHLNNVQEIIEYTTGIIDSIWYAIKIKYENSGQYADHDLIMATVKAIHVNIQLHGESNILLSFDNMIPNHTIHLLYCGLPTNGNRGNHYDSLIPIIHSQIINPPNIPYLTIPAPLLPSVRPFPSTEISSISDPIQQHQPQTTIQLPIQPPILLLNETSSQSNQVHLPPRFPPQPPTLPRPNLIQQLPLARQHTIDELSNEWDNSIQIHSIGDMHYRCIHCNAFYWKDERNVSHPYIYTKCCNKGRIIIPAISQPSPYMKRLLINNKHDHEAKLFNNKARIFNSKLSLHPFHLMMSTNIYKVYQRCAFKV